MAFVVNSIPVAGQCSCTAGIGPHHCGQRTGEVDSSENHWHAVLEHCLALTESYDSSTAVSAVTSVNSNSGYQVTPQFAKHWRECFEHCSKIFRVWYKSPRSSDLVIRQCLSVTQDIEPDITAASESTDSSAWVIGLEHCWAVLKHYMLSNASVQWPQWCGSLRAAPEHCSTTKIKFTIVINTVTYKQLWHWISRLFMLS